MISVLNSFPILDFTSFELENNKIFTVMKILICFENYVVVNFNGVIKLQVTKNKITMLFICGYTLNRSYKWPPYIFVPVQKVKLLLHTLYSKKKSKSLSRLSKLCHFKVTSRSSTDEVRVKVPSFQKVTLFSVI